jgi:tripartite-type tricarboxylate transporter receptor subunit TctC
MPAIKSRRPYRGGAPLATDLLSGQVQNEHRRQGERAAPCAGRQTEGARRDQRNALETELPGIPTMHDSGFVDFQTYQWFGLLAPAGTPAAVVNKLNGAINRGLQSAELGAALTRLGLEAKIQTPQELQQILQAEAQQWDAIVTATGARVD